MFYFVLITILFYKDISHHLFAVFIVWRFWYKPSTAKCLWVFLDLSVSLSRHHQVNKGIPHMIHHLQKQFHDDSLHMRSSYRHACRMDVVFYKSNQFRLGVTKQHKRNRSAWLYLSQWALDLKWKTPSLSCTSLFEMLLSN